MRSGESQVWGCLVGNIGVGLVGNIGVGLVGNVGVGLGTQNLKNEDLTCK